MSEQQLSSNVNRMVQPSRTRVGGTARGLDLSDDRGGRRVRDVSPDMPKYAAPLPVGPFSYMDSAASGWWWMAIASFMEGFALYGASLHPSATFPIDEDSVAAKARQPRLADSHWPAMAYGQGVSEPLKGSNVIAPGLVAWAEQRPHRRTDWLGGLGAKVVAMWTHWRKEHEIRRAVRALAEYDDRTLLDLGIRGRADIERMVRYCRDC